MNSEIIRNIENGTYRLIKNKDRKSKIWKIFRQILKDDGSVLKGVLMCEKCSHLLKYNGKQTSNLIRHKCYVNESSNMSLKKVSTTDKETFLLACSQWVVEDCRPFLIVSGEGFKKMIKSVLDIGTKYGSYLDISDMVPDAATISRRVNQTADETRSKIKEELMIAVENGTASITCDLWTDDFVKRNFLCATFHFVKELKLKEIVLGVKSMDFQKCTGNNVFSKLYSILQDFGIETLGNITFVTDRRSYIVKALKNQNRINCANHLLNNVIETGFNKTLELQSCFEACKRLVKYFKKTNLQHMLSTSPQNFCVTRWNSHLNLFQSITNNYSKVEEILAQTNESQRLYDIDLTLLKALVEIFEKLDIVSRKLQGNNDVTINYVYLTIGTVKTICEEKPSDIEAIKTLKKNILIEMNHKYVDNLNIIHYTACFLYPPTISCLNEYSLNEVKAFCVSEIMKTVSSSPNPVQSLAFNDDPPQDFKLFFSSFIKTENPSISESVSEEVNRYSFLKMNVDINFNVLQWWQSQSLEFPRLHKFAKKILSIPASSAASERVFSAAGNIFTEKCNRIGPKTVNNLLFLNSINKYDS